MAIRIEAETGGGFNGYLGGIDNDGKLDPSHDCVHDYNRWGGSALVIEVEELPPEVKKIVIRLTDY
jgi:hypothetical protein